MQEKNLNLNQNSYYHNIQNESKMSWLGFEYMSAVYETAVDVY